MIYMLVGISTFQVQLNKLLYFTGIRAVSKACKELRILDISKCHNVTAAGVSAIAENLGNTTLRKLNVFGVTKTSNTSLNSIAGKAKYL